ncbi:GNAT family N-acetyltransferase [Ornithinibacillus gellani]|uniref:GNAT family N-acetyltransferase n=1 Tax=Ornithinibacillus gellani TaxID=2293253 RepID=UPI000F460B0B|nr:GNAT family N-acetyltransferase [Ornithinibacillus gellani]TQS74888.1 GNAT family N-acetyltransferase [Ornithinibacillus gellani]
MAEQIPEKNLFMMCTKLVQDAVSELPKNFYIRPCEKNELDIWKAMPFDTPELASEYADFMTTYFEDVYLPKGDLFFQQCMFVCNQEDKPIGTCFLWKSYNSIWTLHWLKVLKEYENEGIGRALLSFVMNRLPEEEYPIFLHTQPESYRAIKLYSDFGFRFLLDPVIGNRQNDLAACLPILQKYMPPSDFEKLKTAHAPAYFLEAVSRTSLHEF